ncbi:MAG: uridine-cytidine kinase [Bacteroidia bacterium]
MPYWVGITGGSASGKTYLLELLRQALPPDKVTFLSTDHYYKDIQEQPRDPDGRINFDRPESINHEKLYADLLKLRRGESVTQREYTFNQVGKEPRILTFEPAPILIAEGLFLFYWAHIRDLFDLRIFMEASEPYRFIRRLQRDQRERGYDVDFITHQYLTQVLPAYEQYVAPLRRYAHLIIQNHYGDLMPALAPVLNHLKIMLERH